MAQVTLGKVRGLSTLSDERGVFHILACDQRGAIRKMMREAGIEPTHERVVRAKLEIVQHLSPLATGALLDPEYGAGAAVAHRTLSGRCGLVVAIEATGYTEEEEGERLSHLLPGWSAAKAKAMGASAVKLLIYYNPNKKEVARRQEALVEQVADECRTLDLPLMLEPLVYPTDADAPWSDFLQEREGLILESAHRLSRYDVDLYKVEFPYHPDLGDDYDAWVASCRRLTEACRVPWAVLSAGVNIDTYAVQLEAACEAGASGFVAGRAIWKEAITLPEGDARDAFLAGEMVQRLERLAEIASKRARPWYECVSHAYVPERAAPEGWYLTYGDR